jgi:prepilin-type N-terminal cleavage/methylation domain-containing protein
MKNKAFTPPFLKSYSPIFIERAGFTLLELVVVILIVGVLATLGFTQYGRMVERSRQAEAKQIIGDIRKLTAAYYLTNGSLTGIADTDINIGTASDQIPSACTSSHYFSYNLREDLTSGTSYCFEAWRCTSGGKLPNGSLMRVTLQGSIATGSDQWNEYWY